MKAYKAPGRYKDLSPTRRVRDLLWSFFGKSPPYKNTPVFL